MQFFIGFFCSDFIGLVAGSAFCLANPWDFDQQDSIQWGCPILAS